MALDIGPPDRIPSEAEIQDLERQLGFRLPNRFRALLPQLNGARAEPNVIKGSGEDYGIIRFKKIEHIAQSKNAIDSENPSDLLLVPFADDGCGDWFCVVAADCPEKGTIYFVDHEISGDEAFSKIAANLDELLECAKPDIDTDSGDSTKVPNLIINRAKDVREANKSVGLDSVPEGYTWHHVEDGVTMQLVPTDLHDSVRHAGGIEVRKARKNGS